MKSDLLKDHQNSARVTQIINNYSALLNNLIVAMNFKNLYSNKELRFAGL